MRQNSPRLMIVGATGVFGSRLVEQLDGSGDYEFILAGRDPSKADALVKELSKRGRQARFEALDRNCPEASRIAALKLLAVISWRASVSSMPPRAK